MNDEILNDSLIESILNEVYEMPNHSENLDIENEAVQEENISNLSLTSEIVEETSIPIDTEIIEEEEIQNDSLEEPENIEQETSKSEFITIEKEIPNRFSGASWFNAVQQHRITLAGLGGIGSWVTLLLGRLRPYFISLYDPDRIDLNNGSGQCFSRNSIGTYKIEACSKLLHDYSDYYSHSSYSSPITSTSRVESICICGFDNMEARKTLFTLWKNRLNNFKSDSENNSKSFLFIDGRLAAEEFQIFCIKGDDEQSILKYEKEYLFSDEEAEATVCSYKQTSHIAAMIASFIINYYVNFCDNLENQDSFVKRDLPFMTYYDAANVILKTR